MASHNLLPCLQLLLATLLAGVFASYVSIEAVGMYPFNCSGQIKTCSATLYHINKGLQKEQIASLYSVNSTEIRTIFHADRQDYLITVPCSCKNINGTTAYFYDTFYKVQQGDTFVNISVLFYSGQAWMGGDGGPLLIPGRVIPLHLLCGCTESNSQIVVTYTIQRNDTLSDIARLLSSTVDGIQRMNYLLIRNPGLIEVGWVLFAPVEITGVPAPSPQ